jgi:hypothetical protein
MTKSIWTKPLDRAVDESNCNGVDGAAPDSDFDHLDCAQSVDFVLGKIHTGFGKLAYVVALLDTESGIRYRHQLSSSYGEGVVESVLRERHQQLFAERLLMTLDEQQTDLSEYLLRKNIDLSAGLERWISQILNDKFVPACTIGPSRDLFWADLQTVLTLIRSKASVARIDEEILLPLHECVAT